MNIKNKYKKKTNKYNNNNENVHLSFNIRKKNTFKTLEVNDMNYFYCKNYKNTTKIYMNKNYIYKSKTTIATTTTQVVLA